MKNLVSKWAVIFGALAVLAAGLVQGQQKMSSVQDKAGNQWLMLMNKDSDKTVDKKEFLSYMEMEFDKADTDHDGTLDAAELGQLRMKLAGHAH